MQTKKLTIISLFIAISLIIFMVESMLPPIVPIPGIKLGLANIVTLLLLKCYSAKEAAVALFARILLSTFFYGTAMSLLYSIAGGLFCLLSMTFFHKILHGHFLFITSIIGALFHNLGQLSIALFLTKTAGILVYLPFLIISGIMTGLFTGLCGHYISLRLLRLRVVKPFAAKSDDDN